MNQDIHNIFQLYLESYRYDNTKFKVDDTVIISTPAREHRDEKNRVGKIITTHCNGSNKLYDISDRTTSYFYSEDELKPFIPNVKLEDQPTALDLLDV